MIRLGSRGCAGTGRHPGPLYGVTVMDLALAAWYAAQVGELHALVAPARSSGESGSARLRVL